MTRHIFIPMFFGLEKNTQLPDAEGCVRLERMLAVMRRYPADSCRIVLCADNPRLAQAHTLNSLAEAQANYLVGVEHLYGIYVFPAGFVTGTASELLRAREWGERNFRTYEDRLTRTLTASLRMCSTPSPAGGMLHA